jgi:hypothetical protein
MLHRALYCVYQIYETLHTCSTERFLHKREYQEDLGKNLHSLHIELQNSSGCIYGKNLPHAIAVHNTRKKINLSRLFIKFLLILLLAAKVFIHSRKICVNMTHEMIKNLNFSETTSK